MAPDTPRKAGSPRSKRAPSETRVPRCYQLHVLVLLAHHYFQGSF